MLTAPQAWCAPALTLRRGSTAKAGNNRDAKAVNVPDGGTSNREQSTHQSLVDTTPMSAPQTHKDWSLPPSTLPTASDQLASRAAAAKAHITSSSHKLPGNGETEREREKKIFPGRGPAESTTKVQPLPLTGQPLHRIASGRSTGALPPASCFWGRGTRPWCDSVGFFCGYSFTRPS